MWTTRTIGLLGGMSWESTALYYRLLNQGVKARLGGLHSAKVVLWSVDFDEIERMQRSGDWEGAGRLLAAAARGLEAAGADFLVLATNTMHKVAPAIEAAVGIPLLHLADATGEALVAAGHRKVGLLGTRFTMEEAFYRDRLAERFALDVLVPGADDRELVHRVIYDELCLGRVEEGSRTAYRRVVAGLVARGATAVVLGCTEIGMLLDAANSDDAVVPLFDTTLLHAARAVEVALGDTDAGVRTPGVATVAPVAFVRTVAGAVADDVWGGSEAEIELAPPIPDEALAGLEAFSHVEVLFLFHEVDPAGVVTGRRHPRDRSDWPSIGIFAQRGRNRPNRLGATICRVLGVAGRTLRVAELDAIDGTPVLDLKPVMGEFLPRGEVRQPDWSREVMARYWDREPPAGESD